MRYYDIRCGLTTGTSVWQSTVRHATSRRPLCCRRLDPLRTGRRVYCQIATATDQQIHLYLRATKNGNAISAREEDRGGFCRRSLI